MRMSRFHRKRVHGNGIFAWKAVCPSELMAPSTWLGGGQSNVAQFLKGHSRRVGRGRLAKASVAGRFFPVPFTSLGETPPASVTVAN